MSSIAAKLPFWHFDDSLMVFSDGSIGAAFRLEGVDISCSSNEEINSFNRQVEDLLLGSEEGIKYQFFYKLTPNVGRTIESHQNLSKGASEVYQPIRKARVDFFKKNALEGRYFVPEIYFFVRGSSFQYKKSGIFEKQSNFQKTSTSDYFEHKKKFIRTLKKVEASLRAANLAPDRLNRQAWFDQIFEYLNFGRAETVGYPEYRPPSDIFSPSLNSQAVLSDIKVEGDAIGVEKYRFQVITLKTLPVGQTFAAMIENFTRLPFHFWISQNVKILDQSTEQKRLQLQRRIARSMAAGSENVSDIESESKYAQVEGLLTELMNGTEKLVDMDFNVIIWGKSRDELEEKADEVLRAMRGLGQAEGIIETLPAEEAYLGSVPGATQGLRFKKMKSSNAAHLLPLYSSWSGNKRPVCLLPNRNGSLVGVDVFAPELPSWNGLFFGSSGSGKSFNIAQLMLSFCGLVEQNGASPRIVWIDNGASSERLIEVLDGEFIDLNLDSGICINMFDLDSDSKGPSAARIKVILTVLERVLKDEDKKGLPKRMKALLEEAIFETYAKIQERTPTLSDLRDILKNHRVEELRHFSDILYSWTGKTAYGAMLDGQTSVKLSKNLVTIEVQSLNDHEDLKDVMLLLLMSYIQDASRSDFERPYLLLVDEAERLFKTEMAKQFVITCYRTWRKFNSGIWCLSQSYRDFMTDEELAIALRTNSSHIGMFRQNKIDWDHFKKTFDFNETQVEIAKSVKVVKGVLSEMFYLQGDVQTVLVFAPEPLSYWICTTDGQDKVAIREIEKRFPEETKRQILERLAFPERSAS